MLRFFLLFSLSLMLCHPLGAQVANWTFFRALQYQADPRARALGEATVALRGYTGAASINPATIAQDKVLQLATNLSFTDNLGLHSDWKFDEDLVVGQYIQYFGADLGWGRWAVAYQYQKHYFETYERRDADNNPAGTFDSYESRHKITLALSLTRHWRIGVGVNRLTWPEQSLITAPQEEEDEHPLAFDLGVYYERASSPAWGAVRWSGGMALTQWGPLVKFKGMTEASPLATKLHLGGGWQATGTRRWRGRAVWQVGVYAALSKDMVAFNRREEERGGIVRYFYGDPAGPLAVLFRSWQTISACPSTFNCWRDNSEYEDYNAFEQFSWHLGLEVGLAEMLYLRYGRFVEPAYYHRRSYETIGIGIDVHYLAFDFARMLGGGPVRFSDSTYSFPAQQTFWRLTGRIPLNLLTRTR